MLRKYLGCVRVVGLPLVVLLICFVRAGYSQTFNSGSTGADGALSYTTPGTYYFDPNSLGLNPAIQNVFNFTTINIASGVTVKLSSKVLNGPVYWLAQGDVTINGTIDLSGEAGQDATTLASLRVPGAGGAGGYSIGVGGVVASGLPGAEPGNGPGGGAAPTGGYTAGGGGSLRMFGSLRSLHQPRIKAE